MVKLKKGLFSIGVYMIIFAATFAFLLITGFLFIISPNMLSWLAAILWGIGGIVLIFTIPVYVIALGMVAASSRDVGKKAGLATLISLPMAVLGVISIFLSIPFLTGFLFGQGTMMGVGAGITMPLGWIFFAAANFCSVGYLRDREHLNRARNIFITEFWAALFTSVFLCLMTGVVLDEMSAFGSIFLLLYTVPPIPLAVIGAVQAISCSRCFSSPRSQAPVRVIPSQAHDVDEPQELPLLPFLQYDFSDTLTPEMFAKGFCFSCQAFVSTEIETCPKCGKNIEREEIVRIL